MHFDSEQPDRKDIHFNFVQKRLLFPLVVILLIIFGVYNTALIIVQQNALKKSTQETLDHSVNELSFILAEQANSLTALLKLLARDEPLYRGLKNEDRQFLYAHYHDLFTQFRDEHKITHFYFHRSDRINLIRIHKPGKYGDLIDRFTTLEAEHTGRIASGVELGPLGTFTLRTVMPVFDNGQLIGYVELGKEIEDALAAIHNKYETECVVTIHKQFLNRAAWEQGMVLLGRKAEWERYKNHVIIYHPPETCSGLCDKLITTPDLLSREAVETILDGSTWQTIAHPLRDVSGKNVGKLILLLNISQQKEAFGRLITKTSGGALFALTLLFIYSFIALRKTDQVLLSQKNELIQNKNRIERYVKAIDDMGIGLLLIDNSFRILENNDTLKKWFGSPEGKLCYQWMFDLDSPCSGCPLQDVIMSHKTVHFQPPKIDGRALTITSTPVSNPDGSMVMMEILSDVTLKKKAEDRLQENEERLRILINSTPDVICFKDDKGRWLEANDAYLKLFSLAEIDYFGKTDIELAELTDPAYREAFLICGENDKKAWDSESGVRNEEVIIKPDGTEKIYDVIKVPIFKKEGKRRGLIVLGRDITERRKAEDQQQKIDRLESIGTLAGGIAHDFNNVLAGIYGNISLAKRKLEQGHPAFRPLDLAEESFNRATNLTNKLLTFSKGGEPLIDSFNLAEIIRNVVIFDLSGSNVKLVFDQIDAIWAAKVDKSQMQQLFSNLAINALQAMPDGGNLYISLQNCDIRNPEFTHLQPGKYIHVSVRDEGCGIEHKYLKKIFDPYFSTKKSGRGLGLSTVYSIVTKHHGHIEVSSEINKGTDFSIYLPASDQEWAQEDPEEENENLNTKLSLKVLVMDDEEVVRTLISDILKSFGCTVETAVDGEEAIFMYQRALQGQVKFDIAIFDLTVPGGLGGKDAMQKLLDIDSQAKVIVSSGYADDPIMAHYSDYGFKGFVEKPFTIRKLKKVIGDILT